MIALPLLPALLAILLSASLLSASPPDYASVFGDAVGQTVRDSAGNFYVAGWTSRATIATTPGAFQSSFGPAICGYTTPTTHYGPLPIACHHGFIVKISPDGATVLFATYLGGSRDDSIYSVVVNSEGNVFVAGNTSSPDFPVTPGSYLPSRGRAFVTKLSADGKRILASTFLPGTGVQALALHENTLYIAGTTSADDFPVTPGAFRSPHYPASGDVYLMKMDSTLSKADYATRLGGALSDGPSALFVDGAGNMYVAGSTTSIPRYLPNPDPTNGLTLFPVTDGAFNHPGGGFDAFILKLNATGTELIYSTVFGGGTSDFINSITVDSDGAVYATGNAWSLDFPTTPGAFQTSYSGTFVLKVAPDGSKLEYSTFLGGPVASAKGRRIRVDRNGNALIDGLFSLFPQPTTPDALRPCPTFNLSDSSNYGFFTILNPAGTALVYSTYMDRILLFDETGNIWLQGNDKVIDRVNVFEPRESREPKVTCVANAATFFAQAVAPGEIVSLFGPGIGPDQPVGPQLDSDGRVATYAAGISVYFNGIVAPLLYLSKNQINAVVPFAVTGPDVSVTILRDGTVLPTSYFRYSDSLPGIFTLSATGYGQAAVLNQDGTLNSASNPAPQGSIISIYATGMGKMTGAVDGQVPTKPTASPVLKVSVGMSLYPLLLDILYAGDAPGSVEGLVQINARVPKVPFSADPPATQVYLTVGAGSGPFVGSPQYSAAIWIR